MVDWSNKSRNEDGDRRSAARIMRLIPKVVQAAIRFDHFVVYAVHGFTFKRGGSLCARVRSQRIAQPVRRGRRKEQSESGIQRSI